MMAYGNGMKKLSPCGDGLITELLTRHAPLHGNPKLLDAGCGRGDRLAALGKRKPGLRLWGVDADEQNAGLAAERCPGAEIRHGDLAALPFAAEGFGAALCECTLSLTEDPAGCLGELYRVLAPGGLLVLGDLCCEERENVSLGTCGTVGTLFSRAALTEIAAAAGFWPVAYRDCREEYLTMAAEMILDGSFCACLDPAAATALRQHRAGYGLWVLRKPNPRLAAVVTTAGLSSRMGAWKPLLPLGDDTVIRRCIRSLLDAGVSDIAVVTGYRGGELAAALADLPVTCAENPDFANNQMFDSLRIGLAALRQGYDRVFITPGDVPLVRPETLLKLLGTAGGFVCPVCGGRRGHPVALEGKYVPALCAYGGEGGLRGAVEALGIPTAAAETDDPGMLLDLDTPADYQTALELLKKYKP